VCGFLVYFLLCFLFGGGGGGGGARSRGRRGGIGGCQWGGVDGFKHAERSICARETCCEGQAMRVQHPGLCACQPQACTRSRQAHVQGAGAPTGGDIAVA
jgi:hypothetical protein